MTWTWLDNEGVHAGDLDLSAYEQVSLETIVHSVVYMWV